MRFLFRIVVEGCLSFMVVMVGLMLHFALQHISRSQQPSVVRSGGSPIPDEPQRRPIFLSRSDNRR